MDMMHDPLTHAVLKKLAEISGDESPLGSFAQTVLTGQASLRDAANHSWHGEALQQAFAEAAAAQKEMSPEARVDIERTVKRLREADSPVLER